MIQQKYALNMIPGGVPVRVPVSQYDADSRGIVFNLYTGDLEFTVPDGAVVTCDGTKPDHKGVSVLCSYSGSGEAKRVFAGRRHLECAPEYHLHGSNHQ